jgi:hypothetical protein
MRMLSPPSSTMRCAPRRLTTDNSQSGFTFGAWGVQRGSTPLGIVGGRSETSSGSYVPHDVCGDPNALRV